MSTTDAFLRSIFDTRFSSQLSSDPALNAFANTLADNNLYKVAASPLLSARMDNSTWSPGTTLGVSAAQAFLGAALQGLGQKWEADQFRKASELLPQMYNDPDSVVMPEDISPAAFEKMRFAASRQKIERDATKQRMVQELFADMAKEEAKAKLDLETKPKLSAATKVAELQELAKMDPTNPDLPENKKNEQIYKIERDYTDTLLTGAEAKKVAGAATSALNILEALKRNDPLGANSAIVQYAKLEDPIAVVREADEERVSDVGGPLGQLSRIQSEILQKGKLTPAAKKAMRELVPKLIDNQFSSYNQIRDSYLEAARDYGANPDRVKYLKAPNLEGLLAELDAMNEEGAAMSEGAPAIPPGMKLQRSRLTGETRLVPK